MRLRTALDCQVPPQVGTECKKAGLWSCPPAVPGRAVSSQPYLNTLAPPEVGEGRGGVEYSFKTRPMVSKSHGHGLEGLLLETIIGGH